ncbi:MAG: hypothetical protein ACOYB3_01780 [Azonexus sp.]
MSYPKPTQAQVEAAFKRHGVNYVIAPLRAGARGRPWASGIRAIVDHHTAGSNSLGYLSNAGGTYPFVNTLIQRDGKVQVLSCLSTWGSGDGGPWNGIAAKNSLHLVGWQNEVEDLGKGQTFTAAQLESLGRVNAALVSLGVPASNEINHRDWTDGSAPVGGYPLPTKGRKTDTKYDGAWLRSNTAKYKIGTPPKPVTPPPPKPPAKPLTYRQGKKVYKSKMRLGQRDSDSVWNLCVALIAKGFGKEIQAAGGCVDDYTSAVKASCARFQRSRGWSGSGADGIAGPQTVKDLGLLWVNS